MGRLVDYLDPAAARVRTLASPLRDPRGGYGRAFLRRLLRRPGARGYSLYDLTAERAALSSSWRGQADVLHFLDGERVRYLPGLLRLLRRLRPMPAVLATFHQPSQRLESLCDLRPLRFLDHAVAVCSEQVSCLARRLPRERVSVIPHGVDVEWFRPGAGLKAVDTFICLTVGHHLRDFGALLSTACELRARADIRFHIVSPPEGLGPCPDNVRIHRDVSDEALLRLYQGAHALFLPLLDATANNALLEGLACGLPVLAADLPGVRDYVSDRKEAVLVSGNSVQAFVREILALRARPELRLALGLAARRRAEELSWSGIAARYQALYQRLAMEKAGDA